MIGGQFNQFYQMSKIRRIINESKKLNENANIEGGSSATDVAPMCGSGVSTLSDTVLFKQKKINRKPIVETHILLDDSDLLISTSHRQERELLSKVGLNITESDDVRVVKTRSGDIKSAMALQKSKDGKIHTIHYVDVDKDGNHFKKGLSRLSTLPNEISFKSSNIEVIKDDIVDGLVIK